VNFTHKYVVVVERSIEAANHRFSAPFATVSPATRRSGKPRKHSPFSRSNSAGTDTLFKNVDQMEDPPPSVHVRKAVLRQPRQSTIASNETYLSFTSLTKTLFFCVKGQPCRRSLREPNTVHPPTLFLPLFHLSKHGQTPLPLELNTANQIGREFLPQILSSDGDPFRLHTSSVFPSLATMDKSGFPPSEMSPLFFWTTGLMPLPYLCYGPAFFQDRRSGYLPP